MAQPRKPLNFDRFAPAKADLSIERINNVKKQYRHRTADGGDLAIPEMGTDHLFNAAKKKWDYIAGQHGLPTLWDLRDGRLMDWGVIRVNQNAAIELAVMVHEIKSRTDLHVKYQKAFTTLYNVTCHTLGGEI